MVTSSSSSSAEPSVRTYASERRRLEAEVFRFSNGIFRVLLPLQWVIALVIAAIWSPRTWEGTEGFVHVHMVAAIVLGALATAVPLWFIRTAPNAAGTHIIVALAQVAFSGLLIHLTGGHVETHFHIFVSLGIIAVYRDWRAVVAASVLVAVDHVVRGLWWPESLFGAGREQLLLIVEHAGYVVFANVVLVKTCLMARRELDDAARRTVDHAELAERAQALQAEENRLLELMFEQAPSAILRTDADLRVDYVNANCRDRLGRHRIGADQLIGRHVAALVANDAEVLERLGDRAQLPASFEVGVGDEVLAGVASGIYSQAGEFLGLMLSWRWVTAERAMEAVSARTTHDLLSTAERLRSSAESLNRGADHASELSQKARVDSQEVGERADELARSTHGISSSVNSIADSALALTQAVSEAVRSTDQSRALMLSMAETSTEIGRVAESIAKIADQTNLLALNASIEAAGAGDAGRGFAVVASEVKELAGETMAATRAIEQQVREIQNRSQGVGQAIEGIALMIDGVQSLATEVNRAVDEQAGATTQILAVAQEIAEFARSMNGDLTTVSAANGAATEMAAGLTETAESLGSLARELAQAAER